MQVIYNSIINDRDPTLFMIELGYEVQKMKNLYHKDSYEIIYLFENHLKMFLSDKSHF